MQEMSLFFFNFWRKLFWSLFGQGVRNKISGCSRSLPYPPGRWRVSRYLWNIKALAGSLWSTVASSTQASTHQHVYCSIWSLVTSLCTSLMHSCPHYKTSIVNCISQLLLSPLSGWEILLYCSCLGWGLRIVSGLFVQTGPATSFVGTRAKWKFWAPC